MILLKPATPLTEEREKMGTATATTMASTISPTMDEIPPTCHHKGIPINNIVFVKPQLTLW